MSLVIKAPNPIPYNMKMKPKVFLAGSIDMGKAENWQERVEKELSKYDILILNPRRDDWDWTWEQSINNQKFYEQVNWEQDMLHTSWIQTFYFDPNGQSPITLMEFGKWARHHTSVVCCPPGFWRKGNVDIMCKRHNITLTENIDDFISELKIKVESVI